MYVFNIDNIPTDAPEVWDLLCSGHTKGIFQCESKLVQNWIKRIKPRNIWELSAVIAIIRPGCLQSNMTATYVENRNNPDQKIKFGNDIIDSIFETTEGILAYQEQVLQLGTRLAWPHLPFMTTKLKTDTLRKAIGKKDQKKLVEIGLDFVAGCVHNKLDQEIANRLFNILKDCGRYLFNLSHSIKYAIIAYQTAYLKTFYPLQFFATSLSYAKYKNKDKNAELAGLINDAKILGIPILPPNINCKNLYFRIEGDGIRYGLSDIKYFGSNFANNLHNIPQINTIQDFIAVCYTDQYGQPPNSTTVDAMIYSGSLSDLNISRKALSELNSVLYSLTDKEMDYVVNNTTNHSTIQSVCDTILNYAENIANKRRREILVSSVKLVDVNGIDHPSWIENLERGYLKAPITQTAVDAKNSENYCIELFNESTPLWATKNLTVILDEVRLTETKNGKNPGQKMAIISFHDTSANVESLPIFPDLFATVQNSLIIGGILELTAKLGKKGWVIDSIRTPDEPYSS